MSSFINKSGKKFTPKASGRRRAPAAASLAKPPSESGTAEPSPAPQSEAGSEYADPQQIPVVNSSQDGIESVAPSIEILEGVPLVKASAPLVDSNGIPVVRGTSVARGTRASESSTSSVPKTTSSVHSGTIAPTIAPSIAPQVRSRSPERAAIASGARPPKRRRVGGSSATQTENTQSGAQRPRSPASREVLPAPSGHVVSASQANEPSRRLTTEALRYTTPVHPSTAQTISSTPRTSSETPNPAPNSANLRSTSRTRQSSRRTYTPKSSPRPAQSPKSTQGGKRSLTSKPTQVAKPPPLPQPSSPEPIVDYEVPGQPVPSPPNQYSNGSRKPTSTSTTPAGTPRPRIPSAVEDDQWQVTTPADLAVSNRINDERRSRGRAENDDEDYGETGDATTPGESPTVSTPTSSARLANAVKRKRKQVARNAVISRLTGQSTAAAIDEAVAASIEGQLPRQLSVRPERPLTEQEPTGPKKRVPKRGVRELTPEENEMVVIAPGITRMNDLTQDMRVGVKSDREKKMRGIDWKEVKRRRKEDEIRQATHRGRKDADGQSLNGAADEEEEGLDEDERLERNYERHKQKQGLQSLRVRNVNGEQVLDEASQFIDRHAMQEEELLEEVEEDDLTKKFNVATYSTWRRKDPAERVLSHEKWTDDATDRFYDFLSQFGTDFMIISKMFSGRTRRHIKAKFVKEERADPERIKQALLRHLTRTNEGDGWSVEAFRVGAGLSQSDLKDPVTVKQELEEIKVKKEEEIEEARKEAAEREKQMRLAGMWSSDEEDEYGSDGEPLSQEILAKRRKEREARLRKAKKEEKRLRKTAEKMGPPTGGEEVEIVETIEEDE
jgi:transcription factor TFIIIB component B''